MSSLRTTSNGSIASALSKSRNAAAPSSSTPPADPAVRRRALTATYLAARDASPQELALEVLASHVGGELDK